MSHPLYGLLAIPADVPVPPAVKQALAGSGADFHMEGTTDKGYDIVLDAAATFVADLEVSVDSKRWETLVSPIVTGQGAIDAHFNFARVTVTAPGVYGDATQAMVAGKERS